MAQIEIVTETVEAGRANRAKVSAAPAPARKTAARGAAKKTAAPAAGGGAEGRDALASASRARLRLGTARVPL